MSRQVLPIVGSVIGATIGFYVGGPAGAVQGAQLGFAGGTVVGNIVDPLIIQGNRVGDSQVQVAAEGGARAIVFGQGPINSTCVIARGNRRVIKKKEGQGKGGGPKVENEYVYWTYAIGLGEAVPEGKVILRMWQDEQLIYDIRPGGQISAEDNAAVARHFRFYNGSETQMPDPDLQAFMGDDTPYFRGTAYVVYPNSDLTQLAERIPLYRYEIGDAPGEMLAQYDFNLAATDLPGDAAVHGYAFECEASDIVHVFKQRGFTYKAWAADATEPKWTNRLSITKDGGAAVTYWPTMFATPGQAEAYAIENPIQTSGATSYEVGIIDASPGDNQGGMSARIQVWSEGPPPEVITLGDVVSALLERAGFTPSEYDVSELTDVMKGLTLQETVSGSDAISSVLSAYFADPSEYDGVLHFVKRGKPVTQTLSIDDLVELPEFSSRENAIEYPAKLHFFYQSPATGYANTKATSSRYSADIDSQSEGSVTVPVVFGSSQEPANIAAKLHKVMWAEAGGDFVWTVGNHCINLVPTDCVALSLRGVVNRARIVNISMQDDRLQLTMRKDRQSAYVANVQAIPLPQPTTPEPASMSKTVLAVLDIPALVDADDGLYLYTAMSGESQTWAGAQLQQSIDDGATWSAVSESAVNAPMGRLISELPSASQHYPDATNVIAVRLFDSRDELDSLTDEQWLSEQGALAIESADGSWELVQYRDAEEVSQGVYNLSMLQRGRLNTSPTSHAANSLVVVLNSTLQRHDAASAWIGTTLKYRGVSYGTSPETAMQVEADFLAKSQREWPVVSFDFDLSGDTLTVSNIIPRHRFGTEAVPVRSVNWQGYRIVASDGFSQVSADFTEPSGVLDVSPLSTVLTVSVAQVNRLTGAGPALTRGVS